MSDFTQTIGLDADKILPIRFEDGRMSSNDSPLISVITPAHNEEGNIQRFYSEVSQTLNQITDSWEIIFVNDGSTDNSAELMRQLHEKDPRCKAVVFSRNYGFQIAIAAGLRASSGKAIVVMDADLQHPPELIPVMVEKWKEGYHVVNTVRTGYGNNASQLKKITSAAFYKVMNAISEVPIIPGACDFRLMDRVVVDILCRLPEQTPFFRALIRWLGFKQTSIPCTVNARQAGVPSMTFKKMIALAVDGMVSFSTRPLRWIMYLGFFVTALVVPYGVWALIDHFIFDATVPGWTSLLILNMLLGGTMLVSLGIIGEYVGRIYNQVKGRPLFTVEELYGIEKNINSQETVGHSWDKTSEEQKLKREAV